MSAGCCAPPTPAAIDRAYRKALRIALVANLGMFAIELLASHAAGSASLLADSIDFFGDAANYALSLAVLGMALFARANAALAKAGCMAAFGVFVLGKAWWNLRAGVPPASGTMGVVGFLALVVNGSVAWMLYRHRTGDANMRSVWLCSRNDALGNLAVMLAALGVAFTDRAWPDALVAAVIGSLALTSARSVFRQAWAERRDSERAGAGAA